MWPRTHLQFTYRTHSGLGSQCLAFSSLGTKDSADVLVQQQCPGHVQCVLLLWDAAMHTWTRTRSAPPLNY